MQSDSKNGSKPYPGLYKEVAWILDISPEYVKQVLGNWKGRYKKQRGSAAKIQEIADRLMAEREALCKEYKKSIKDV